MAYRLLLLLLVSFMFSACANKSMTRYETLAPVLEKQGFDATIKEVERQKEDLYGSNSEFLYYYDLGVLHHYKGDYDQSIKNFEKAEKVHEDLYARSVTNEAAAVLVNDNVRPYRPRPYEILSLYEFQILNYIAKGNADDALVEVNRAHKAMAELYQKDNEKVNDNGFLRYLSALIYEMQGENDEASIAYYKTAKAYEESLLKLPKEVQEYIVENLKRNDREDDLRSLGLDGEVQTPKASASNELGQEIVVVSYAGHSPILGELYMSGTYVNGGALNLTYKDGKTGKMESRTMVAPFAAGATNGQTFHVGFALPEIRNLKSRVNHFDVSLDGTAGYRPEKVVAVDKELELNMYDESASVIGRTALRVVLRTIAAQKTKQAMSHASGSPLVSLFTNIGVDVAQSQMEQADLRLGLFMPNSVQMTRLPVEPGSHDVSVYALGGNGEMVRAFDFRGISVKKGQKTLIIVPAIE